MTSLLQLSRGTDVVAGHQYLRWRLADAKRNMHVVASNCAVVTRQAGSMSKLHVFGSATVSVSARTLAGLPKRGLGTRGSGFRPKLVSPEAC